MLCQASRNSSPWHNFVTDTDHWKEVNGATLCLNNGGIYNRDEMAPMKTIGAKCIWADTQAATFEGSPSPKFSPGILPFVSSGIFYPHRPPVAHSCTL